MKILQIAHGRYWETAGGAELSALRLHENLKSLQDPGIESVAVFCTSDSNVSSKGIDWNYLADKDVYTIVSKTDSARFEWPNPENQALIWTRFLKEMNPDVVHLHHYYNIGIDLPRLIKSVLPNTKVIMTLHEFLAMCPRDGQMIKANNVLCKTSEFQKCAQCVGSTVSFIHSREVFIKASLDEVDAFVSPSHFLMERYIQWGVSETKFEMIPNLFELSFLEDDSKNSPRIRDSQSEFQIGYIGQHTPYKGLDVLLGAAYELQKLKTKRPWVLNIFGDGFTRFPEYKTKIDQLIAENPDKTRIKWRGRYEPEDVQKVLSGLDLIVVPSIWWENSPLVIQEAKLAGIPILVSNIGGMAENVVPDFHGDHFERNDTLDLANKLHLFIRGKEVSLESKFSLLRRNDLALEKHISLYSKRGQ